MVVLAFITDPRVLEKILAHLGLPTAPPPIAPARLPLEVDLPLDEEDEEPPDKVGDDVATTAAKSHRTRSPPAPA